MPNQIGQLSEAEFFQMFDSAKHKSINLTDGLAWIMVGNFTDNYYRRERDGSWTNYDCRSRSYGHIFK